MKRLFDIVVSIISIVLLIPLFGILYICIWIPNAKKLGETSLMFLIHPTLTNAEMDEMCNVIDSVFLEAKKH